MFTGIVTDVGRIAQVEPGRDARAFLVESRYQADSIALGASIAHAGVCLTVIERDAAPANDEGFTARHRVEVSQETLSKTSLGDWRVGRLVNLERALKLGDELGGHMVAGHVDALGALLGRREENGSLRLTFRAPWTIAGALVSKGSIAIDGVSLTVNEVEDRHGRETHFGVNIIPHTAEETTLGALDVGDPVNLEIDLIARHIMRLDGLERAARRSLTGMVVDPAAEGA